MVEGISNSEFVRTRRFACKPKALQPETMGRIDAQVHKSQGAVWLIVPQIQTSIP